MLRSNPTIHVVHVQFFVHEFVRTQSPVHYKSFSCYYQFLTLYFDYLLPLFSSTQLNYPHFTVKSMKTTSNAAFKYNYPCSARSVFMYTNSCAQNTPVHYQWFSFHNQSLPRYFQYLTPLYSAMQLNYPNFTVKSIKNSIVCYKMCEILRWNPTIHVVHVQSLCTRIRAHKTLLYTTSDSLFIANLYHVTSNNYCQFITLYN